MKKNKSKDYEQNFRSLALDYLNTGEIGPFLNQIYPWLLQFTGTHLSSDPDLTNEFVYLFYTRLDFFLQKYARKTEREFLPFFIRCIRFEFYNFLRKHQNHTVEQITVKDIGSSYSSIGCTEDPAGESSASRGKLEKTLAETLESELPDFQRVVVKLHYGFPLHRRDLEFLHPYIRDRPEARQLFLEFASRDERNRVRLETLLDRSRRLSYLINTNPDPDSTRSVRLRRWKKGIRKRLNRNWPVFNISEIARIFDTPVSTTWKRFQKGKRLLKERVIASQREDRQELSA